MNIQEPILLKELRGTDYKSLIKFRVHKILMICSHYDAFILEEDGQIEAQISKEYVELNLSTPPKFVWCTTSAQAYQMLEQEKDIDMVICMYNLGDKDIFRFATDLKAAQKNIPFVLLTHFSKEIHRRLTLLDTSSVDYIFTWQGNADLIVAIIKLYEDKMNADNDILGVGVQAILLVEDNVRFYSTYLPELYRMILKQGAEFLKETLNEQQQKFRKRSHPKVLLATNLDAAMHLYEKYKSNLLGVISDVEFAIHKDDAPGTESPDAGIQFVKHIKADDDKLPILLQSSQESISTVAEELNVGFLRKYSKTLMLQLSDYIKGEFGFGDFVFKDSDHVEYGRAFNLKDLEKLMREVPDHVLMDYASKNKLSRWLMARGLFTLGMRLKNVCEDQFSGVAEIRAYVCQQIHDYHTLTSRGVIAHFDATNYDKYIWFSRIGEGSIGGKARGLAFLNSLIYKHLLSAKYPGVHVSIPRTIVVATDYFDQFILENDLQYVIDSDITDEEVLSEFVSSRLPDELIDQLRIYLDTVTSPLAIRSSSKLEDSSYQPFAGVYSTYMIPFAENKDQMLRMLEKTIKSVYASVYYSGSRAYINTTANILSEEKMAIVIQSICGTEHNGLYYPMMSGVARSVNYYPIGSEKQEDGIIDFAFGLGKIVVEGGNSLRVNPKFPKKILQLSDPKLALRDTQKSMYALDLRSGAFKISRNETINLEYAKVSDMLPGFPYPELVASTFSVENNRMVPGITTNGPRVISFDAILRYGRFPISQMLRDIMSICKAELMCEVEIEFAVDVVPESKGSELVLKLLQVRPACEVLGNEKISIDKVTESMHKVFVKSTKALGSGRFSDIDYILSVPSDSFDSAHTSEMAEEISRINEQLREKGASYLLVGPGRWGSSDPWLGIPVAWSDISEAKMIVETAIPGYRIEPSQGTHFFQNITSLGVGYLTIDTVLGDGHVDEAALEQLECIHSGTFVKLYKAPEGFTGYIDRTSATSIIGC